MDDLISRKAMLAELAREYNLAAKGNGELVPRVLSITKAAMDFIKAFPAVEAEPVRHGLWIPDEYGYNHCSECGFEHDEREYVTPYCPDCGANMDLEEDSK